VAGQATKARQSFLDLSAELSWLTLGVPT
jgi:hypothetical protein